MKMNTKLTMTLLTATLLSAAMITPVLAATHKSGEMTCEDFLALNDVVQPKVVYWSAGLNQEGDPMDAVIDVDATDRLVPVLVTECQETPKVSFWDKIKEHF
jgi:hypothetical protein